LSSAYIKLYCHGVVLQIDVYIEFASARAMRDS